MSRVIASTATALALILVAPTVVLAGDPDKDRREEAREAMQERREEAREAVEDRRERRADRAERDFDDARDEFEERQERRVERAERAFEAARDRDDDDDDDYDDDDDDDDRRDRRDVRRALERQVFQTRDGRPVVYFQRDRDRGLIAGCPPGLDRRNNGCVPPGLARQAARAAGVDRYDWLWRSRDDDSRYRYDDGYLYRMNRQGSLLGYLPLLGGALAPGATWPSQYAYQPAPDYYSSYFGLPQGQDYRYADGALYGVNPQTNMISRVAALLTGQNLSVGQPLPSGFDVYNVPYDYRNQYADSASATYRYNDGYVYQADPKTQLVTAVIQLLT